MNFHDATGLLNAESHLLFHNLVSGPDLERVTLRVEGAQTTDREIAAGTGDDRIDRIIGPVPDIQAGPGCLRYTLRFQPCITYAWRREHVVFPEQDEDGSLNLRHYERSAFRDYVAATTFAAEAAGYPLEHFAVVTRDAVIDVICREAPDVTAVMLDPDDPGPNPDGSDDDIPF